MIAIVIPSLGEVDLQWSLCFSQVVRNTSHELTIFTSKHYRLDWARNLAVMEALKQQPSHLLFWDSDIIPCMVTKEGLQLFTRAIDYMLELNYPVVSAVYYTSKLLPNCFDYVGGKEIFRPVDLSELKGKRFFCDGVGLGFCLIDARVFSVIEPPWFEYKVELSKKANRYSIREVSEDLNFCLRLHKHGFKVFCLGELWCRHIHKFSILEPGKFELVPTR